MYVYKPARELLPPEILSALSPAAASLYAAIWNRMAYQGRAELTIDHSEISRRARVRINALPHLNRTLFAAGLMDIALDTRPDIDHAHQQVTYRFPFREDEPTD